MVSPAVAKAIEKGAQKYIEHKGMKGVGGGGSSRLADGPFDKLKIAGRDFGGGKGVFNNIGDGPFGKLKAGIDLGKKSSRLGGLGEKSNSIGDTPKFDKSNFKEIFQSATSEVASRIPIGSFNAGLKMGEKWNTSKPKENKKQKGDTPVSEAQNKDVPDPEGDVARSEEEKKNTDAPKSGQQGDAPRPTDQKQEAPKPEQQGDISNKPGDQTQEKDTPATPEEVATEAAVEEVQTTAQETVEDLTTANVEGDVSGTPLDSVEAEYADYNPEEGNTQSIEEDRIEERQEQQQTVAELEADAALGLLPVPSQVVEAESRVAIAHEGSAIDAELIDQSSKPAVDAGNSSQSGEEALQEAQTPAQETMENFTAGSVEGDVDVTNPDADYTDRNPQEGIPTNVQTDEDIRAEEIQEQQQIIAELETDTALGLSPDPSLVVEDANIRAIKDEGALVDLQLIDRSINPDVDTVTLSQTGEATTTQSSEVMPESATVADQGVTPENSSVSNQNALLEAQSSNQAMTRENIATLNQDSQPETIQEVSTASSQQAILENQVVANQDTKLTGEQLAPDTDANLQRSKEEGSIAQGDNATSETAAKSPEDTGLYIEFTDVRFGGESSRTPNDLASQSKQEAGGVDAETGKQQSEPGDANVVSDDQQKQPEELEAAQQSELTEQQQFQRQLEEMLANHQRQLADLLAQFQGKQEPGEKSSGKGDNPITDALKKATEKGRGNARKVVNSILADTGEEVE